MVPLIMTGMCVAQDPDNGAVNVLLSQTGQGMPASVKVGYYGPSDALRIQQQPLPGVGSWGLLAFPHGDIRTGIWVVTLLPSGIDAITSSASGTGPTAATDAFLEYKSHWSGHATLLDAFGQTATQWIDGSYFAVAADVGVSGIPDFPTLTRHVVNDGQVRTRQEFTFEDRVPELQDPPFNFGFSHDSGTQFSLDSDGNIAVSGIGDFHLFVSGAVTIAASGDLDLSAVDKIKLNAGTDIDLTASGSMDLEATQNITINAGSTVTISTAGGTSVKIDGGGNVIVTLSGGIMEVGGTTNQVVLAQALVTAFNNHVHGGVSAGPGFTLSPLIPLSAAAIGSAVLKTSA